jgi:hypothetical protein
MADYIFNVFLHTDRVELKSEYISNLPSFYFAVNEFVSIRADINIPNSVLSCSGANIYNAVALIGGRSQTECPAILTLANIVLGISIGLESEAIVAASVTGTGGGTFGLIDNIYLSSYSVGTVVPLG